VATRDIAEVGFAPVVKSELLEPGEHKLALDQRLGDGVWLITVNLNGTRLLSVEEPKEWNSGSGSVGGGHYSQLEELPADKPVILFRRRFTRPDANGQTTTPTGPTEGLMLWIEPVTTGKAKP
jgi:hypothetical protein